MKNTGIYMKKQAGGLLRLFSAAVLAIGSIGIVSAQSSLPAPGSGGGGNSLPAPGSGGSFRPAPINRPGSNGIGWNPGPGFNRPGFGPGWVNNGPGWVNNPGWGGINAPSSWTNQGTENVMACGYDAQGNWRTLPLQVSYTWNGFSYDVTVLNAWNPWTQSWNIGVDMPAYSTSYYINGETYDFYTPLSTGTYYFNL